MQQMPTHLDNHQGRVGGHFVGLGHFSGCRPDLRKAQSASKSNGQGFVQDGGHRLVREEEHLQQDKQHPNQTSGRFAMALTSKWKL